MSESEVIVCRRCLRPAEPGAVVCRHCGEPVVAGFSVLEPLEHPVLVVGEGGSATPEAGPVVSPPTRLRRTGTALALGALSAVGFAGAFAGLGPALSATCLALGTAFGVLATLALRRREGTRDEARRATDADDLPPTDERHRRD